MITTKNFSFIRVMRFTGHHIPWLVVWMSLVAALYQYADWKWLTIPWIPISVIGTAVAFYVGFKNNQAYDRMWEARKIWGAIINSSREWGTAVKNFTSNQFTEQPVAEEEIQAHRKKIIYRHIGWLYALRSQLLMPTPWEHSSQKGMVGWMAKRYQKKSGIGLVNDDLTAVELHHFLPEDEYERFINSKNTATQIIDRQGQELASLRAKGIIDDFRHMHLQGILGDFYAHQGKAERIKKFPLPRQYANMSFIFVAIFVFLLPFGMVSEFAKLGPWGVWLSVPFAVLVGWVFVMMEIVGDYSENPFQGMANDIPMLSLSRTIEIDLREMLGETDLPSAIKARKGILM